MWSSLTAEASSYLTVPEVTLISLLDILLGPSLVMIFFGERPTPLQLLSGIAIFVILVLHEVYGMIYDKERQSDQEAIDERHGVPSAT